MKSIIIAAGVLFSMNSFAETCIQVKENKRYFDRALKAYPGLPKKPCIKLPHLEGDLNPLALRANEQNQTAFLAVKSKNDPQLNEVHYIDTKEGKIIKKFTFKGHFNRSFLNLSDTFVPFDNDSKLAFSREGNLCIFDLRKSTYVYNQDFKAPLHYCIKPNLGSGEQSLDDLESLTLSKNKAGSRYLWSLVKTKNKKHIYGFKIDENNKVGKSALHKFELPSSLKNATRVSLMEKAPGEYTFGVSTSLKDPESNLYQIKFKKNTKDDSYSAKDLKSLSSSGRKIAASTDETPSVDKLEILDFINLRKVYRSK
jgi:hypothetical protein